MARFAVLDYKTNWLGEPGRAADRLSLPPGGAVGRDVAPPLRAAGAAVHRRPAPLPALAAAGYDPDTPPRRRRLPVRARDDRARTGSAAAADAPGVFGWRPPAGLVGRAHRRAGRGDAVSAVREDLDPFDARLAQAASGLLRAFNEAGVLSAADVHVARRLGALAGEDDESVLLAVALAVRAPRLGHVHVDLERDPRDGAVEAEDPVDLEALPWPDAAAWVGAVAASPLVAAADERCRRAAAAARRLAVPGPLLGRGGLGRRRPAGDAADAPAGIDGAVLQDGPGAAVRRGARRPPGAGRGRRRAAALRGRGRRPGHRQDDDGGADRRAAVRAGRAGRRAGAARGARGCRR